MPVSELTVLYGHLEGTGVKFTRDPSGYLSIEAGIFRKHGLEVSWEHVQGTEERYRRLENGTAHLSLVVGRASLQHFLASKTTCIVGCAMNGCPYYLLVDPSVKKLGDLKGQIIACRDGPVRSSPVAATFRELAQLRLGTDLDLQLPESDQAAFDALLNQRVQAALLPRPYGFIAEEKGFRRIVNWPEVVDDPLPITIETTKELLRERRKELASFTDAHKEGIRYLKTHRWETVRMLQNQFGHSPELAAKTYDEYLSFLDERLTVDLTQLEKLIQQVAPDTPGGAQQVAADWIVPGGTENPAKRIDDRG
jgi:ABC-type nitrate/sulfonate/bicarbonate transport system substrate-binding protein